MPHSPVLTVLSKSTLALMGFVLLAELPAAQALTLVPHSQPLTEQTTNAATHPAVSGLTGGAGQGWLLADKNKDDDDDDDDDDKKGRVVRRVDLNRAKNLARQAAEEANGGIRVYRAEASMFGPASECPYVDNGDSWTFTFRGGRPGLTTYTTESVVTVYKNTSRVVVAYNGPVRTAQYTQISSFTTSQRTVLVDLLQGDCSCNYLLGSPIRRQIVSQRRSLPPGIQKQLLRGKGLPPGLAKKLIPLPKQVNQYVNLPNQYDLAVVGSNLLLIDQTRSVIVDMISNAW